MEGGPSGFRQGFTCPALLGIPLGQRKDFAYGSITLFGRTFQIFPLSCAIPHRGPATPSRKRDGLGSSVFARRYLRNHIRFLFLRVLRCFTSPGIAPQPYEFRLRCPDITRDRLPHSEISGSKCVCHSPELIAAYHVLHRLPVPRHSSCALLRLTRKFWPSRQKLHALSLCSFQRPGFTPPGGGNILMVELIGIEPTTCGLQSRRSPS